MRTDLGVNLRLGYKLEVRVQDERSFEIVNLFLMVDLFCITVGVSRGRQVEPDLVKATLPSAAAADVTTPALVPAT